MDHHYSSGNWMVMPNGPNQIQSASMTNSDHSQHQYHHQQQLHHHHQQQQQHHNHLHQSLASHFHLLHLMETLADATENGTRDQHSDFLVNDLTNHFEKCQQLLNSISGSISTKVMTVEGQKHKLEESEQLLNQRKDLITKYRSCVEELLKSDNK